MKVLVIAANVYYPNENKRSFTGLDYVISEISSYVGKQINVDLFSVRKVKKNALIENCNLIRYSNIDLIKAIRLNDFRLFIRIFQHCDSSLREKIKNMRSVLTYRFLDNYVKNNRPDCIHIHSAAFHTQINTLIAIKYKIPILYTLHGLNNRPAVQLSIWSKNIERNFLKTAFEKKQLCSVVSSGVKKNIDILLGKETDNFRVILNAVSLNSKINFDDCRKLKERYGIQEGDKVFICVGTISNHKNQIQLVRAYSLLPEKIKENIKILFLGKDDTSGEFDKLIEKNSSKENLINCGFIDKKYIQNYYSISNYNIVVSRSEGFGLSIIESMHYGIPTLTFSDIDAIEDIYNVDSIVLIKNKDDISVMKGLIEICSKKWNKNKIKKIASKFDKSIYNEYIEIYKEIYTKSCVLNKIDIENILEVKI